MNLTRTVSWRETSAKRLALVLSVASASSALAQAGEGSADVSRLLNDVRLTEPPSDEHRTQKLRYATSAQGYVRWLAAPDSRSIVSSNSVPREPEATAYHFLRDHASIFGWRSPEVDLVVTRRRNVRNGTHLRFQQTYGSIPVFGAEVITQVNSSDGIDFVLADIATDTEELDRGTVSLTPSLTAERAAEIALGLISDGPTRPGPAVGQPVLTLFAPSVLGTSGPVRLVWDTTIIADAAPHLSDRVLVDAHDGQVVRRYPLARDALEREIYDADNTDAEPGTLVRAEGDPASGIADADAAYDLLADTYAFFDDHHGRDSIDGSGMLLEATVRYCDPQSTCPYANAFWDGAADRLFFGEDWVVDDILGHEFTHGVTDFESNLIYENHSGAINESFSDVWGEFIDLTNGTGTDSSSVRWEIGEDLPDDAFRDMSDPPRFDDPDRLNHPDFVAPVLFPSRSNDWGGVHTNSGVNNKLCYLLTDGANFNQWSVYGVGLDHVAALYYEVNAHLLSSAADYTDLYYALEQAAVNLGWLPGDRINLHKACAAVEIADTDDNVYVDGDHFGLEFGSDSLPFSTIAAANDAIGDGERMIIKPGSYDETLTFNKDIFVVARSGTVVIGR